MVRYMDGLLLAFGTGFLLIMGALCFLLWWKMWTEKIKLDSLLAEVNGQASMSRFQLLVFTLVVAAGVFMYLLKNLTFPDIPTSVLYLVGISATTYGASKAITYSRDEGVTTEAERDKNRAANLDIHKVNASAAVASNQAVANAAAAVSAGPVADAAAEGAFAGAVVGAQVADAAAAGDPVVVSPAGGPAGTL